jgi:carbon storage regulator
MLVLSRKSGESIKIADNIEIKIIDVIGERVKVGINAPKDLLILRAEVPNKKLANQKISLK